MSSVVSTSTKHELARGGLEFPPGVVVASPHFLAVHLEVTAPGYRALIFTMILEIAIAVHHVVVTATTVDRFRRVHCEYSRINSRGINAKSGRSIGKLDRGKIR